MRDYKAVIFDLDGVIVDSEPLHEETLRKSFSEAGITITQELLNTIKGRSDKDIIEDLIHRGEVGPDTDVMGIVYRKHDLYVEMMDGLQAVSGAIAFIHQISSRYRLALTTSAVDVSRQKAFDKFGLDSFFEVLVTANDITKAKPDPEPYLLTVDRLSLQPQECLVIEDSTNGVRSAAAAGCDVVGLTTTFSALALLQAGASFTVDSFSALERLLD